AAWVPPCVMQTEVVDLLINETENSLGALYFCGAMRAVDEYPPPGIEGIRLIEQYNLFGDCSLVVRSDTPVTLPVSHPPVLGLNASTYSLDVPGVADAVACLYRDGVIHGSAITDGAGHADISLSVPVTELGIVTLTVTARNAVPFIATVDAVAPVSYSIVPDQIDANVPVELTVTVLGPDGFTPQPGIEVWAEGFDYATTPQITDSNGIALVPVDYPYGPTLNIVGQDPGAPEPLFTESIPVNAAALFGPDLAVTGGFGLADSFAVALPGTLHAVVQEPGFTVYALLPDGSRVSGVAPELAVTPDQEGVVVGTVAVAGYDLYQETFPVILAAGTLSFTVTDDTASPLADVTVSGYDQAEQLVFQAITDGAGIFQVTEDIPLGDYIVRVDHFGFTPFASSLAIGFGDNSFAIVLIPTDHGILSGVVTAAGSGDPLIATVSVYRADTMELISQVQSDFTDGNYSTDALPFFDYRVTVKAWQYQANTVQMTIDDAVVAYDVALVPASGELLVLDDASKAGDLSLPKFGEVGEVLAGGYTPKPGRAAAEMVSDLEGLGYTVTLENASDSDPAGWDLYDLVIVSAGGNTTPLNSASFRNSVQAYVTAGGHLLIEVARSGTGRSSIPAIRPSPARCCTLPPGTTTLRAT
ncbi:MAG: carboxypeptidase regulatory-like domain-containing protein, partial [bacterium]